MPRILFVYSRPARFVEIDRALLAERWDVRDWAQPGRWGNPVAVLREVLGADLVFGWFASWHTFWPITIAWLLRKPSVLVIGGFDTANLPDIGYGYQRGGTTQRLSRWIIERATSLVTNSYASRDEIGRNIGIPPSRVQVVHHGFADDVGRLPDGPRERMALTVANVAWLTFERKGLRAFVEASRHAPDVQFVLAGKWMDSSIGLLRELAGDNVTFAGRVSDEELLDLYSRASVYVQASRHEGFGMTVAEAMLAGAIPVTTRAGALPEVVGDVGVQLESGEPAAVAAGVRAALELPDEERARARDRVLERFPLAMRREGLHRAVEELLR